jgi:hypothetical protein
MPPTTWSSLGCYTDTTLLRTLNVSMLVSGNTVEKCQAACATGGYTYSGTEFGTQCFCGKELLNGGAPSEDGCTSPCAGNVAEICGGSNRLSIYTVTPIWQSMGCWTDATLSRTLNTTLSVSGNTIDKCQATCNANGFKYSGTEFGSQCFCGNAIMNNNIAVSDGCTMACQGNPNQICGGSGRLSLSLFA